MKKIMLLIGILSGFGWGAKDLSSKEKELVQHLDFNIELMKALKKETKNQLRQLPAIDGETAEVLDTYFGGIHSTVSEEKANAVVQQLKEKFREQGYLIFVFTGEEDENSIAVIKGTNELDILRYRGTNGINYDVENSAVVAKMAEWKDSYGLTVLGCGRDWLELEFKKLPTDLDAFAEEVYAFCPDTVDQGVGDLENLKLLIREMHGLWLWWD